MTAIKPEAVETSNGSTYSPTHLTYATVYLLCRCRAEVVCSYADGSRKFIIHWVGDVDRRRFAAARCCSCRHRQRRRNVLKAASLKDWTWKAKNVENPATENRRDRKINSNSRPAWDLFHKEFVVT